MAGPGPQRRRKQAGRDRSCRPHASTSGVSEEPGQRVDELRRLCLSRTAIARRLNSPVSTVGITLRQRCCDSSPRSIPNPRSSATSATGQLIHTDIKKRGRINGIGGRISGDRRGHINKRGKGREFVHVAIDGASRSAYTELLAKLGIKNKCICPYTPRTNGKAERLIQTSPGEWAYAQPFKTRQSRPLPCQTDSQATPPHAAPCRHRRQDPDGLARRTREGEIIHAPRHIRS